MRRLIRTVAAVLLVAASACASSVTVHSTTAPNANLGRYRTYAFMTPPGQKGQPQSILDQDIQGSLRASLAQKGFLEVAPAGSPDFLVAYHAMAQQKVDVESWGYGYGYGWRWGGPEEVNVYTQGTIIVDFIDARTNQAFWRGTASAVVDNPGSPDAGKIAKAVDKLVKQYPTTATAQRAPSGY